MPRLKGSFSIGRMLNSGEEACVLIHLDDDSSGTRIVTIHLTPHELAMAFLGSGNIACEFDWYDNRNVGKVREHKQVAVWIPQVPRSVTHEIIRIAVARYEVDGWMGNDYDAINMHNRLDTQPPPPEVAGPGDWRHIRYTRFVDPPASTPTEESQP